MAIVVTLTLLGWRRQGKSARRVEGNLRRYGGRRGSGRRHGRPS
jgi:hypothetical protein